MSLLFSIKAGITTMSLLLSVRARRTKRLVLSVRAGRTNKQLTQGYCYPLEQKGMQYRYSINITDLKKYVDDSVYSISA